MDEREREFEMRDKGVLFWCCVWVTGNAISASHTLVASLAPFLWLLAVHGQGWWCMRGGFGREAAEDLGLRRREKNYVLIWLPFNPLIFY